LADWDRSLRAGNYPATTRYNYLLAASQLARFLAADTPNGDAAATPEAVTRAGVEAFQAWMVATRSASTALNKHKALQQFFKWLTVEEEVFDRSPMRGVRQPKTPKRLVPVIAADETTRILQACKGRSFAQVRDEAIIRVLANTGARLSEVTGLGVGDVDLDLDTVCFHGKGAKDRRVRLGPRTARALSRYLRARASHPGAGEARLWLAIRGERPLGVDGVKALLRRRGRQAGVAGVHAHRWRHTYAHEWKLAGGDSGDLMLVLGWTSDDMPRHYGASAAAERAQAVQARMRIGDDV
jgi:integrase